MLQFMMEALMMSVMAFVLTAVLIIVLLAFFNYIADKTFTVSQLLRPSLMGAGLGISVGIGILAGIYPAVILCWI